MSSMKLQELEAAMIKKRFELDPFSKTAAIALFILENAQVAQHLKKILELDVITEDLPTKREHIAYLEKILKDSYRRHFGTEIGESNERT